MDCSFKLGTCVADFKQHASVLPYQATDYNLRQVPKMGGCDSKASKGSTSKPKAKPRQVKKKDLNPADYVFSKQTDAVLIRKEGTIDGEQFNLEECKNCDIFLLDTIATSFVDDCHNCRVFIGPVETSVFIRNCTSCSFVIACQQYRCRDCQDCKLSLYCGTEPIIESSQNMQFACFDFNYFSLRGQMARAGLKPWNNKWWMVYDFNKNEDKPNWGLLNQDEASSLLRLEACAAVVTPEELENERVVPITLGSRPWPTKETCFVVFLPDSETLVEAFLSKATAKWAICRARSMVLQEEQLKTFFAWAKEPKLASKCKGQEMTGIQVCGQDVQKQVQDALNLTGMATGAKNIRIIPEKETEALAKSFFETWKDEV
ncbi:Rp2 [Symbiodinium sp. CCMP2456]|nr:Rp2 [Symbiodinium sp. CCMP2456]